MSEFVLIVPLIVVILALLFYTGGLIVRAQRGSVLARYETWRDAEDAPGPRPDPATEHAHLNRMFFESRASSLRHVTSAGWFPEGAYDRMRRDAASRSGDAGRLADRLIYRPDGAHRRSRGRRDGFAVRHEGAAGAWDRIASLARRGVTDPERAPMRRGYGRIGTDWAFTDDWQAAATAWAGAGSNRSHLRGLRDAFLRRFDRRLDGLDGGGGLGNNLPGLIRRMYLDSPGYRGPILD